MFSGVVFDLDGVLIDSHLVHKVAWRQFLLLRGRCRSIQKTYS